MLYRTLGRTGIRVSALAFGTGPVSGLMTGDDRDTQFVVLKRAFDLGINWIDTAAGYGQGKSEANIGRALREIRARESPHVATKVRLELDQLSSTRDAIRRSFDDSLNRLGVRSVTLLQLHNGLTARRGDEPFTIAPADVLATGGVLDVFRELRDAGLVSYLGLTGTGQPTAMREVVHSGGFDTIQVPYHLLNPSAGQVMPATFAETDYGNIIADCTEVNMGVFAIRVFAGGALLGQAPSAHTLKTPFFPLDLYESDRRRAGEMATAEGSLKAKALRFVVSDSRVHAAIVGFADGEQIDELTRIVHETC